MKTLKVYLMMGLVAAGAVTLTGAATPAKAQCVGNCGTDGADGVVTLSPTGNSSYNYISTNGGVTGAGSLGVGGETNGSLDTSAVFNATAGQTLTFYFNYVTSDGSGFPDYAWSALHDVNANTNTYLFTARTTPVGDTSPGFGLPSNSSTLNPATSPIIAGGTTWSQLGSWSGQCYLGVGQGCGYTGWIQSTYVVPTAGTYDVQFGVTNANDTQYDSGLAWDGLAIDNNPIPGAPSPAPGQQGLLSVALILVMGFAARFRGLIV